LLVADRSYQPVTNAPRIIVQDSYGGQLWAYPVMLAPSFAGFNRYYPNAWTPTGYDPAVPQGQLITRPALPITGGFSPAVGSNDTLTTDCNGTNYASGWVTTATAFGTGPIPGGTSPGEVTGVQGFIGKACVNT
jgi:hypothetical protein